jgi:cyclohexanone monooxygenase
MPSVFEDFQFDPKALREKYNAERDKRLKLRPEGEAQFVKMKGVFEHYLEDPYTPVEDRPSRSQEVEVVVVGGGFGGLLAAARLREQGVDDFLLLERGGDFGGTWYWNRYPGAACDVESYIYLPLLEETGTIPSAKYVQGPEISDHIRNIAKRYDLYPRALMHTVVKEAAWDDTTSRWIIKTDRGDELRARFMVLASGHYREPRLPGIPGMAQFKAHSFHTSRWDYDYTGGDAYGNLHKLKDKVVGIIGTGATAVQCVPHLGAWSKQLYVFQRTPSSVDFRGNHPTDVAWFKSQKPGWQYERMRNFQDAYSGQAQVDLIDDGWTRVMHRNAKRAPADMTPEQFGEYFQLTDMELMEGVRRRVEELVTDPSTAESLKPWYDWLCKRPCFHDEFLQTFNRPTVTLVDTEGRGIERLTENGIVANGQEYKVDCLIYASGFEVAPYEKGTAIPIYGRDGQSLAEKWRDGATTMHGIHVHGFPNFMNLGTRQSSWANNFPHALEVLATHIAHIIGHAGTHAITEVEVTAPAEADWVRFHEEKSTSLHKLWRDCTPSYFNQEGNPEPRIIRDGTFGGSVMEFADILSAWRSDGELKGLELR